MDFVNPKVASFSEPVDNWYRYYAGYSSAFVNSLLDQLTGIDTLLDPWNGTGTSTVVAASRQISAVGYDVNPAMVITSRARLLDKGVCASIEALANDIVAHATPVLVKNDPLLHWFTKPAASHIRGLQASSHRLLVDSSSSSFPVLDSISGMSTLAAFFYTSLFRTLRLLIEPKAGSNPTWWKKLDSRNRLRIERGAVIQNFIRTTKELSEGLHRINFNSGVNTIVDIGDSKNIKLNDSSIDAVISSPPYCTRIDYGISTLPELSILGADEAWVKTLRDAMVGTPTMTNDLGEREQWGNLANQFLTQVEQHDSAASKTYYYKFYAQYYSGMWNSLRELRRVVRPGGHCFLVVQDNYYKEIRNDCPAILMEMANILGFNHAERHDFKVRSNLANINPRSKKYRQPKKSQAVESIITLR